MTENKQDEQYVNDEDDDFTASEYSQKYVIPTSIFEIYQCHKNLYYIKPEDMVQIKAFIAQAVKNRLKIRKRAKDKKKTFIKKATKQIPYIYQIDDVFVSPEDKKIEIIANHPDG